MIKLASIRDQVAK